MTIGNHEAIERFEREAEIFAAEALMPVKTSGRSAVGAWELPEGLPLPQFIRNAGDKASWRFVNYFTAEIENDNTRAAYLRAIRRFDVWCGEKSVGLAQLEPFVLAAYLKEMKETHHPQSVKQHLAALRMLFDNLVVGQVLPSNPAASVKGPKYSTKKGKAPVLSAEDARVLLNSIDCEKIIGLRDRALIAVMVFSFARVSAVVGMNVEDFFQSGRKWRLRLHEKGGKYHEVMAHHNIQDYLHAYLDAAVISEDPKSPLFRTVHGASHALTGNRLSRRDALRMVKRRAISADVDPAIGCHTFRATGITTYLKNGGIVEKAQALAGHSDPRTTGLYDRRDDEVGLDEIERIVI